MSEKVANGGKKLELDANKLGKVKLGEITLKRVKTHINQCESCESPNYHVWYVQYHTKSIGTITYCQDCMEHQQWGKDMAKWDENHMVSSFQQWLTVNMQPIEM